MVGGEIADVYLLPVVVAAVRKQGKSLEEGEVGVEVAQLRPGIASGRLFRNVPQYHQQFGFDVVPISQHRKPAAGRECYLVGCSKR